MTNAFLVVHVQIPAPVAQSAKVMENTLSMLKHVYHAEHVLKVAPLERFQKNKKSKNFKARNLSCLFVLSGAYARVYNNVKKRRFRAFGA